jgi:hypothetical protein
MLPSFNDEEIHHKGGVSGDPRGNEGEQEAVKGKPL